MPILWGATCLTRNSCGPSDVGLNGMLIIAVRKMIHMRVSDIRHGPSLCIFALLNRIARHSYPFSFSHCRPEKTTIGQERQGRALRLRARTCPRI